MAQWTGISKTVMEKIWGAIENQPIMQIQKITTATMEILNPIKASFEEPAWIKIKKPGEDWKTLWEKAPLTSKSFLTKNLQLKTDIGNITIAINQEIKKGEAKTEIVNRTMNDIANAIKTDPNVKKALFEKIGEY